MTNDSNRQGSRHVRRRGGRRRAAGDPPAPTPQPRRRIPAYELLAEEALCDIKEQADWVLAEIGIEFRGDEAALSLFRDAGCSVDGPRVRFDRGHARALCSTAPATFRLHGRDPERSPLPSAVTTSS